MNTQEQADYQVRVNDQDEIFCPLNEMYLDVIDLEEIDEGFLFDVVSNTTYEIIN